MIYYIYRTAAEEKREVNKQEEQMIKDINSGKIRVLAETEEPIEKELAREESVMKADDIESQFEEEQQIKRDDEKEREEKIKKQRT